MMRWMLAGVCALFLAGAIAADDKATTQPATTQPTTQATPPRTTLRKPPQATILRNLVAAHDRTAPIQPRSDDRTDGESTEQDGRPGALMEGTVLVERPGRLVHDSGRARFIFHMEGEGQVPRSMIVLENQWLETMEREAEVGFAEFIISAEVTRYRGENYLLLRKVLRRTGQENIAP